MWDKENCSVCGGSGRDKKIPENACAVCMGKGYTIRDSPVPELPVNPES